MGKPNRMQWIYIATVSIGLNFYVNERGYYITVIFENYFEYC